MRELARVAAGSVRRSLRDDLPVPRLGSIVEREEERGRER